MHAVLDSKDDISAHLERVVGLMYEGMCFCLTSVSCQVLMGSYITKSTSKIVRYTALLQSGHHWVPVALESIATYVEICVRIASFGRKDGLKNHPTSAYPKSLTYRMRQPNHQASGAFLNKTIKSFVRVTSSGHYQQVSGWHAETGSQQVWKEALQKDARLSQLLCEWGRAGLEQRLQPISSIGSKSQVFDG